MVLVWGWRLEMAFISTKWRPDHVTDSLSQAKADKERQQFSHFDRVKITHCCLIKESWEKYIKTKQKKYTSYRKYISSIPIFI